MNLTQQVAYVMGWLSFCWAGLEIIFAVRNGLNGRDMNDNTRSMAACFVVTSLMWLVAK